MNASNPTDADITQYEAIALLHNMFSVAFAYPEPDFIASLKNGAYTSAIKRCVDALNAPEILVSEAHEFEQALDNLPAELLTQQLESEYISLFELSKDQPPLHLNAHLYGAGTSDPVSVYQHLIKTYQEMGIEPKSGPGIEKPDHLSVQLEFQAYLYQLLDQSLQGKSDRPVETIATAIHNYKKELLWIDAWRHVLEQRGGHALYTPLGRMLLAILENTQPS